ncbi:MAG: ABC transporter ATP-binding protein, partial [Ruminococcus sp.]
MRGPKPPVEKHNVSQDAQIKNPMKTLKRLLGIIMKKYKFHMIFVFIFILLSVFANVQGTLFIQKLIDDYINPMIGQPNPDFTPLLMAIARVAIFYLLGAAASYAYSKIMIYVAQGTMRDIRCNIFSHMESLPIKYFDTHKHGDIMSVYTNDVDTLRQMISQSLVQIFSSVITIVSVLASMIVLSIPLTLLTLFMIFVMLFVVKNLAGKSGKYFLAQQTDLGNENGYIEEIMNGQKVVKVFNHEKKSIEEFRQLNDKLFDSAYNANKFANIIMPINAQISNISYVLCAILGGVLALTGFGGFTLGKLVSFLTFNKNFSQPINQVTQQINSIIMALAGAERIFSLLDEKSEEDNGYVTLVNAKKENGKLTETEEHTGLWAWKHVHQETGEVEYKELKGALVMDDVDFGYNDDKIVLHNIDITAAPGEKIAFVGSTGAGKTTITNLINRFYDIQDGKIRYDGININ